MLNLRHWNFKFGRILAIWVLLNVPTAKGDDGFPDPIPLPNDTVLEAFNNRTLMGRQFYKGIGFTPYWFVQVQFGRKCNATKYKALKIDDWWDDYFKVGVFNDTKYEELNELFKEEMSSDDVFKKALADVCFAGVPNYSCEGGKCGCRKGTTAITVRTYKGGVQRAKICAISRGEPCAMKTRPGDYMKYRATRRRCAKGQGNDYSCCRFFWKTGDSKCVPCTEPNAGIPTIFHSHQILLPVIFSPTFRYFH